MQHERFYLAKGAHEYMWPIGPVCLLEAAIVAAGFPYRPVHSRADVPDCFSPSLSVYGIHLNEASPDRLRQGLLARFITKLPFTTSTFEVEAARAAFIALETCRRIISPFCRDVLKQEAGADLLAQCTTLEDAYHASDLVAAETRREAKWNVVILGKTACSYARYGVPVRSAINSGAVVRRASYRCRKRQEEYLPIAAQILDAAIMLGPQGQVQHHEHAEPEMLLPA
jgi:hypothetical protein